ncbi:MULTISPECIES: type II toxin-antitoxin system HicA family toxin [Photorhabdus]|uniref:Type II toxin-antitoxin system HicA family toxin n=3 Tax=Photorhabdus TaxID=29487 RepID=A0A4R4JS15_9GAMM|nr:MULTISPECIES: type II toxin-antitoxin system HicA family toxin [Photorhabdus]KER03392.1 YcfA-like protein [Photorhabdus temperata subsp. temperata Meg1]NHB94425.1 type II toxin-antitoxin system HicA family toxin [Photorhabdus cinerea]TDB57253.1 type II toxin-antitoxin system HicA family toxin [Photorhabdus khanii subsp. guanajuatensis]
MGSGLYPQLRELLLANGCHFVRQGKGSHEIWRSDISNKNFSVPYTIVSKHTANAILRQAGINLKI